MFLGNDMKHMAWRIRLGAQDTALSRLRHEFESRMRYHEALHG